MNFDRLKKSVGTRVQLVPLACRLDTAGVQLPPIDDDWVITMVDVDGIRIENTRTGHVTTLGKDHVHHFTSNPDRSDAGIVHGFLTLNVQVFLQGAELWVRPNVQPGAPVAPPVREVVDRWVNLQYPAEVGLVRELEAQGYRVGWCRDRDIASRVDVDGWELVEHVDANGVVCRLRLKDFPSNQTFIKKRMG